MRLLGGAVAQLGARLDGIEEVVGSNPIGSTNIERDNHLPFDNDVAAHPGFCTMARLWLNSRFLAPQER